MYICDGTTWSPTTGDATADPKVILYTGTTWPDRPSGSRPALFVGGSAFTPPDDADLHNGDMWISDDGRYARSGGAWVPSLYEAIETIDGGTPESTGDTILDGGTP